MKDHSNQSGNDYYERLQESMLDEADEMENTTAFNRSYKQRIKQQKQNKKPWQQ